MNIKIVSFRKHDTAPVRELEEDYLKRIRKYASVELIDVKRDKMTAESVLSARDLEKAYPFLANGYSLLLSERGKEYASGEFAAFLKRLMHDGTSTLTVVIGGPAGVPAALERACQSQLSLSRMTLPHQLARLFLIEALYRSFDILHGGQYNK